MKTQETPEGKYSLSIGLIFGDRVATITMDQPYDTVRGARIAAVAIAKHLNLSYQNMKEGLG